MRTGKHMTYPCFDKLVPPRFHNLLCFIVVWEVQQLELDTVHNDLAVTDDSRGWDMMEG